VASVRRHGSRSPLGYLESLIAPDGSVRYSRTGAQTPVWVTAQALTALAGKPFPIAAPHARASAARGRPARTGGRRVARVRSAAVLAAARAGSSRAGVLARALGALIGALRASVLGLALSGAL
jgi:hypothetical protein